MSNASKSPRKAIVVKPDQGRQYDMGRMHAEFFADGDEVDGAYSISKWWLEPQTPGPGAHAHPEDHIFYVLEGTLSLVLDGERTDAPPGTFAVIPGGTSHDFENHGDVKVGFISINQPAGFEQMMPMLVDWFAKQPLLKMDED